MPTILRNVYQYYEVYDVIEVLIIYQSMKIDLVNSVKKYQNLHVQTNINILFYCLNYRESPS